MYRASARTMCAPGQKRSSRRARQRPRRRNRPDAPMPSKPQGRLRQHHLRHWKKIHHVSARTIYAPGQKQSTRRAYQRQRRRSKAAAPVSSGQRNPAQRKRLRGIIFIQDCRKFDLRTICRRALRCRSAKSQRLQSCAANRFPNRHQKMRRTFSISSRLVHGRRAALNLIAAARRSLFVSGQRSHRRTICRPRRRIRPNKPL